MAVHDVLRSLWNPLGAVPSGQLADARIQLHWASQILSAAADALVVPQPDDSHSNLGWSGTLGALLGRPNRTGHRVALRPADNSLLILDQDEAIIHTRRLNGETLKGTLFWLGELLGALGGKPAVHLSLREYDMPHHGIKDGLAFGVSSSHGHELARWFANADMALKGVLAAESVTGEVRLWPHHFDIGALLVLDSSGGDAETAPSVGLGLSPGDTTYPEPYWYATAWPKPPADTVMAELSHGHWHTEGFTGAILTAEALLASEDQYGTVDLYFRQAINACKALLA